MVARFPDGWLVHGLCGVDTPSRRLDHKNSKLTLMVMKKWWTAGDGEICRGFRDGRGAGMDEWTIKTPNPRCRFFFKIDMLTNFDMFNRFYRLEIHSLMVGIFRPSLLTIAPMKEGTILVYCCPSTFSLTSPLPKVNVQFEQTVCGCGGGGC